MPNTSSNKLKLLYLIDLFREKTDEDHGLAMREIIGYLKEKGLTADRRTIYGDLSLLEEYGFDVERTDKPPWRYYFVDREFDLSELKFLIDTLQSSKFLSQKTTKDLIEKIKFLCSQYEAAGLERQVVLRNRLKGANDYILFNVDAIQRAISQKRQITFQYGHYDASKDFTLNKNNHQESPFALIYADENYYMLAFGEKEAKFVHFRVDRMKRIEMTDIPVLGQDEYRKLDLGIYTKSTFYMYSGEMRHVTIRFHNHLAAVVIDRFGKDTHFTRVGENHFKISVQVAVSPQFFGWILGLGRGAKIVGPPDVVEETKQYLAKITSLYEDREEKKSEDSLFL